MQRMQVKGFSAGSQHGQVVLEDPDGMVQLSIRMRPMMAHWLAHELKECQCPAVSMYLLLQELLTKFGGNLRVSLIDASADNTPLGLLIISCPNGVEIRQACHPADAIAMAARRLGRPALWLAGWLRKASHSSRSPIAPKELRREWAGTATRTILTSTTAWRRSTIRHIPR